MDVHVLVLHIIASIILRFRRIRSSPDALFGRQRRPLRLGRQRWRLQGRPLLKATAAAAAHEVVVGVVEDELGGGRDDAVAATARVGDDERIGPGFGIGKDLLALK